MKRKGFSLVELSIVLIIIGLIVTGVVAASNMVKTSKLSKARLLTNSSPVISIENMDLWLDATSEDAFDLDEAVNGASVTKWYDRNTHILPKKNASSIGAAPTYDEDGINDLPALSFDGENQYLSSNFAFRKTSDSSWTIILVVEYISSETNMTVIGRQVTGGEGFTFRNTSDEVIAFNLTNSSAVTTAFSPLVSNNNPRDQHIFIVTNDGNVGSTSAYINGNLVESNPSVDISTSTLPFFIGALNQNGSVLTGSYANVKIGEIIIFSKKISNDQRQKIENYLSQKWDINISP